MGTKLMFLIANGKIRMTNVCWFLDPDGKIHPMTEAKGLLFAILIQALRSAPSLGVCLCAGGFFGGWFFSVFLQLPSESPAGDSV